MTNQKSAPGASQDTSSPTEKQGKDVFQAVRDELARRESEDRKILQKRLLYVGIAITGIALLTTVAIVLLANAG